MTPIAREWCFEVDAKFERNGVISGNTLKCVTFVASRFQAPGIPRTPSSTFFESP
jgi:hypothetical protein